MDSSKFWKLLLALGAVFALPWLFLVLIPYLSLSNLKPVPYAEDNLPDGGITQYPDKTLQRFSASDYGRDVYASEGCAYCHTQVVRPTYAGPDMWRPGWGGREDEGLARETRPQDYETEPVSLLGYQRIGPDLSNVGSRITTREEMHKHLYEPKSIDRDSGMPAYKYLYRDSPFGKGYVPTEKAEALVDYLLSLKKDQPLPAKLQTDS